MWFGREQLNLSKNTKISPLHIANVQECQYFVTAFVIQYVSSFNLDLLLI